MIKIHKNLYVVKGIDRRIEDSNHLLSYMTYTEYDKDQKETKKWLQRKATGLDWAIPYRFKNQTTDFNIENYELYFDNTPVKGFKIIGSVSRWSTDNKLIRIEDPRGFVVEIPTSNLTTLLKNTIVDHGEILDCCVWGKENNNNILLPISSDIYKKSVDDNNKMNNRISYANLEVGDVFNKSADNSRNYVFIGKYKIIWRIEHRESKTKEGKNYGFQRERWVRDRDNDPIISEKEVISDKYYYIYKYYLNGRWYWDKVGSGSVIKTGEKSDDLKLDGIHLFPPSSVLGYTSNFSREYLTYKTVGLISKNGEERIENN